MRENSGGWFDRNRTQRSNVSDAGVDMQQSRRACREKIK